MLDYVFASHRNSMLIQISLPSRFEGLRTIEAVSLTAWLIEPRTQNHLGCGSADRPKLQMTEIKDFVKGWNDPMCLTVVI